MGEGAGGQGASQPKGAPLKNLPKALKAIGHHSWEDWAVPVLLKAKHWRLQYERGAVTGEESWKRY